MTGSGVRFKKAGYKRLKPFIKVHDRPIIEWVVKMFPNDKDKITFICRKEHLDSLESMKPTLKRIAPDATIFSIENWKKTGPVGDVLRAADIVDDKRPVIICYCDYYMHWDYIGFKKEVFSRGCAGAVPCYSGFHPHLIPKKNLYASCKVDVRENLIEIREKYSWETNKKEGRHSPGVYYFKTGELMKEYCHKMVAAKDHIFGEFYASLVFNYLVKDKLEVWCPVNVTKFCQWGTPEDLKDYLFWMDTVRKFKR